MPLAGRSSARPCDLMRQAIRAAGLPDRCVPHGVRKATLHGASADWPQSLVIRPLRGSTGTRRLPISRPWPVYGTAQLVLREGWKNVNIHANSRLIRGFPSNEPLRNHVIRIVGPALFTWLRSLPETDIAPSTLFVTPCQTDIEANLSNCG